MIKNQLMSVHFIGCCCTAWYSTMTLTLQQVLKCNIQSLVGVHWKVRLHTTYKVFREEFPNCQWPLATSILCYNTSSSAKLKWTAYKEHWPSYILPTWLAISSALVTCYQPLLLDITIIMTKKQYKLHSNESKCITCSYTMRSLGWSTWHRDLHQAWCTKYTYTQRQRHIYQVQKQWCTNVCSDRKEKLDTGVRPMRGSTHTYTSIQNDKLNLQFK